DTFYVGHLKGVGRVYQQTFIDTYTKVACAKLYDRKTPITAADLLNDRVIPLFDGHDVKLLRLLTDRGSEYCGNPERHEYELYLAIEDIDHSRTKTKSPQTNGLCQLAVAWDQHPIAEPEGPPSSLEQLRLPFGPGKLVTQDPIRTLSAT